MKATTKGTKAQNNPHAIKSDQWYEWVYKNRVRIGLPIYMEGDNPELAPGAEPGSARHHGELIPQVRSPQLVRAAGSGD